MPVSGESGSVSTTRRANSAVAALILKRTAKCNDLPSATPLHAVMASLQRHAERVFEGVAKSVGLTRDEFDLCTRIREHVEKSRSEGSRAERPERNHLVKGARIETARPRPGMDFTLSRGDDFHSQPVLRVQQQTAGAVRGARESGTIVGHHMQAVFFRWPNVVRTIDGFQASVLRQPANRVENLLARSCQQSGGIFRFPNRSRRWQRLHDGDARNEKRHYEGTAEHSASLANPLYVRKYMRFDRSLYTPCLPPVGRDFSQ